MDAAACTEVDKRPDAYYAGYFDGEGCVGFHARGKGILPRVRISVGSTNLPSLLALQCRFGGNIVIHSRPGVRKKSLYNWRIGSLNGCLVFILAIEQHSLEKRVQLALVRQWLQHRAEIPRRGRRSAETYRLAEEIRIQLLQQKHLDFYETALRSELCCDESAEHSA